MKVSIVLCTYNGERYLSRQLDSIFKQTRSADEVLVQDDGSIDGTWSILRHYADRHPQMRLLHNEGEHGVNANFYSAMMRATGDVLLLADQDDIWLPHKTQTLLDALGDNLLVASMSQPFSSDDDPEAASSSDTRVPNVSLLRMLHTSVVAGHTMALRPQLLSLISPKVKNRIMYDAAMQIAACAAGRMAFVPEVLVMQRRHTDSATYTAPLSRSRSPLNIVRTVWHDLCIYRRTRPAWRRRMTVMQELLGYVAENSMNDCPKRDEAMRYVSIQLHGTYLQSTMFCLRHHRRLLHAVEPSWAYSIMRALFFPISSAVYVR